MEKEKQQDNPKMSSLKKILFAAVFAAVSVTTCGCESYVIEGYRTYPRYEHRTIEPFFNYPSYYPYMRPPTHRYLIPSPRVIPPRQHPPTIRPSPPTHPNIPHRNKK